MGTPFRVRPLKVFENILPSDIAEDGRLKEIDAADLFGIKQPDVSMMWGGEFGQWRSIRTSRSS
jgi:hypothetical protein